MAGLLVVLKHLILAYYDIEFRGLSLALVDALVDRRDPPYPRIERAF